MDPRETLRSRAELRERILGLLTSTEPIKRARLADLAQCSERAVRQAIASYATATCERCGAQACAPNEQEAVESLEMVLR